MNDTMIKNIMTPIIGFIVAWLAKKFPVIDPATWDTLVNAFVTGVVAVVLGFFNRTTNLMNTVGNQLGTTVVTTPANAAATSSRDVIAATPQIVNAVKNAETKT